MLTRDDLLHELAAGLDERLSVETPLRYGEGIIVDRDEGTGGVLVVQPNGPHFVVLVEQGKLEVRT